MAGGAPQGATLHGSSMAGRSAPAEPVSLTRDVPAAQLRTAQVTLTDDNPTAQLLAADSTRRDVLAIYVDPAYGGPATRVFITGSSQDANQRRNGIALSTGGPIYGLSDLELAGAVYAYADPASDGTLNGNGGLTIFVAQTTGQVQPNDLANPDSYEPGDPEDETA